MRRTVDVPPTSSCGLSYPWNGIEADLNSPGWVHTGLTGAKNGDPKPAGAWSPEQTVDYMVQRVFEEGDFYVVCPDNETSSVSSPFVLFAQS